MESTIRAVTFDCWGTLITDRDMAPASESRIAAVMDIAPDLSYEEAGQLLDRAWRVHIDAWVSGEQYGARGMAAYCVEQLGFDPDGHVDRLCLAFEDAAGTHGQVEPLQGAAETLRDLKETGVRTALVCDTGFSPGRVVRGFLQRFGLAEHLDFLAFSNEVGVPKPHPRIFHTALEAIDAQPEQAVHVGDLRRTDIAGARGVGMRTVRIAAVHDDPAHPDLPEADAVVLSHSELTGVLRSLGAPL